MSELHDALSQKTGYEDFKYILQTRDSYLIGSGMSYADCLSDDDVPFKFRAIIEHYILKDDISTDTSLESHLYYLDRDSFAARTYMELKAKAKVWIRTSPGSFFGIKRKESYKEQILSIKELTGIDPGEKEGKGLKIGELILPKLSLMGFNV